MNGGNTGSETMKIRKFIGNSRKFIGNSRKFNGILKILMFFFKVNEFPKEFKGLGNFYYEFP